jgi:NAD(P)-dependent dehydrogenase (short-subunit alcohol dehydrogenase family)
MGAGERVTSPVALVAGANRGIGFEVSASSREGA